MTGAVSNGKRKAGTVGGGTQGIQCKKQAIEDAAGHLTSRHLGLASDVEPLLLHYLPPGPRQECHLLNSCLRRVAPNEADASAIPGPVFVDELDVRRNYNVLQRSHTISLDAIENLVAPCGPALLDVFFAKVHPLCPVLVERSFRAAYDVYVSSTHCHGGHPAGQKQHAGADAPRARREDITPALLAAVYLVSLPYLGEQEGTTSTAASTPLQGCPPQYEAARPDISRLMLLTSQLLTESLALAHHWPLLTTLQAGVLAAQHPELNTPMLISQLVALTFDLGLHVDCGGWAQSGMSDVQRGARRRLAWSVYALDKWASTVHGRPYLIRDDEWGVAGLCLDDFVGVTCAPTTPSIDTRGPGRTPPPRDGNLCQYSGSNTTTNALLFMKTVSLTCILSEILAAFYTVQALRGLACLAPASSPPSVRARAALDRAKPIQLRLRQWYAELPLCLRMESQADSQGVLPSYDLPRGSDRWRGDAHARSHSIDATVGCDENEADRTLNGSLHLAYFATEITLHRMIIRSLASCETPAHPLASPSTHAVDASLDCDFPARPSRATGSGTPTRPLIGTNGGHYSQPSSTPSHASSPALPATPAPTPSMTPGPDEHIIHICRSAAKTRLISALDFVNRLRPHHLASPWPFYARFCLSLVGSFGVLLRITAKTKSEYAFYGRRLGEYIWTLGVSQSWGGSWVAWASERVREVVDAANQAAVPEKPDVVEPVAMAVWSGGSSRGGTSASGGGGGGETAQAGSTAQSLSRPWAGISTDPGDGPGLSDPENDSDDVESDGSAEDDITGPDTAERSATSVEDDRSDSSVSPGGCHAADCSAGASGGGSDALAAPGVVEA